MNRILAVVLLVAGGCLLVYGLQASHSFSSDVSRLFTGSPTDRAIWLIVGGAAAAIAGAALLLRGSRR
jgi:uncharacterized protein DUF3185